MADTTITNEHLGAPGTITVVDPSIDSPSHNITDTVPKRSVRKRKRQSLEDAVEDEVPPQAKRVTLPEIGGDECDYGDNSPPTYLVGEKEVYGERDEEPVDTRTPVQRFLDAKHRRRRLGRHMAREQVQEDLEDVKKFLSLSHEDREAYLSIYEYDGTKDDVVAGLAKASSLALRVGLLYTVHPKDYDLAAMALDTPEVKDSLENIWDCVDLDYFGATKTMKAASAVGHIGDTILAGAMKMYQGIQRASALREAKDAIRRRDALGVQSLFDPGCDGKQFEAPAVGVPSEASASETTNHTNEIVTVI